MKSDLEGGSAGSANRTQGLLLVAILIALVTVGFGVYYYGVLQAKIDASQQKIESQQQDVNAMMQKAQKEAEQKAVSILSKGVPVDVRFNDGSATYQITNVTKYWLKSPTDSKSIALEQMGADGVIKNHDVNVPANKSIIAISVFITNSGKTTYSVLANQFLRPIFTTPEIRAKSGEGPMESIEAVSVSVPYGKSYQYNFLFYADYGADHTDIRYGLRENVGDLLVDFNQGQ